MTDEELLELINKAVSDENERQSKIKKTASLNLVESGDKEKKTLRIRLKKTQF